jgi:CheY-like chemotaxis protein
MLSILVADDNAVSRRSLRCAFEQDREWSVVEATDGREAVEKVTELTLDVGVLDFAMPGVSGIEAATLIRRIRPRMPLILFTAYVDDFLERQAFEAGFSLVVSKYESANRLADKVRLLMKYRSFTGAGKPDGKRVIGDASSESELALLETSLVDPREQSRISLVAPATIYSDRHGFVSGQLSDISASGFTATLPIDLAVGDAVNAELCLPAGKRNVSAIVRHKIAFRYGFEILGTTLTEELRRLAE